MFFKLRGPRTLEMLQAPRYLKSGTGAIHKCDRHAGGRVAYPVVYITERYCLVIIHNWR